MTKTNDSGITGPGGVFHVVKDPVTTRTWRRDNLGIDGAFGPQLGWVEEFPATLRRHRSKLTRQLPLMVSASRNGYRPTPYACLATVIRT